MASLTSTGLRSGSFAAVGATNPTLAVRYCPPRAPLRINTHRSLTERRFTHRAANNQDRDHPAQRPFGDPHQTSPPKRPPAPQPSTTSFPGSGSLPTVSTSSDLEFGCDALSGSTLETPAQLEHQNVERLHQQDLAREAYQTREAAQGVARLVLENMMEEQQQQQKEEAQRVLRRDESTAEEREERYQGILQALDQLGAQQEQQGHPNQHSLSMGAAGMEGASDDEGEALSPEAQRLASLGSSEDMEAERFDMLRHTVDELGEGDEAAQLIMQSYEGRNLEAEALGTLDPTDHMPHPGDRYLPPHALPAREPPPGAMTARLNPSHSRQDSERRSVLPSSSARGAGSSKGRQAAAAPPGAWLPPSNGPLEAARASHNPVGRPVEGSMAQPELVESKSMREAGQQRRAGSPGSADDQIELGGPSGANGGPAETADDQIDYEQDAMRGADAMYYTAKHTANPAVNDVVPPGGTSDTSGGNVQAPEGYDVEGDALRGGDAMFYFKASKGGRAGKEEQAAVEKGPVWGALHSPDEELPAARHDEAFRKEIEEESLARTEGPAAVAGSSSRKGAGGLRIRSLSPSATTAGSAVEPAGAQDGHGGSISPSTKPEGREAVAPHSEGVLASVRSSQAEKRQAEASVQQLANRLKEARSPPPPEPRGGLGRVLEVAIGRAAAVGLGAAFFSELMTGQGIMSQLLGRMEGPRQIEYALPGSQRLAVFVLMSAFLVTLLEHLTGDGRVPRWRPLGFSPLAQVWLGRAAQALFLMLLLYEAQHSSRPAFSTLFYLWF